MSVKGKLPFVEYVASQMSVDEIDSFKLEMNTSPALTQISWEDLTDDMVDSVSFKFGETDYKNGIIVNNDDICVLFVFYDEQKISIYDLDKTNGTYKEVKEYCTIFELRTAMFGAGSSGGGITPSELLENIEGSDEVIVDLNQGDSKVQVRLDQDVKDVLFYKQCALADIEHDIGESNTIISLNGELFDPDSCYDIVLEIEGTGSHYGTRLVAMPYNNSQCFTSASLYMATDEDVKVITTMDNDGQINITLLGYLMTPESQTTTVHYKKMF